MLMGTDVPPTGSLWYGLYRMIALMSLRRFVHATFGAEHITKGLMPVRCNTMGFVASVPRLPQFLARQPSASSSNRPLLWKPVRCSVTRNLQSQAVCA